MTDVTESFLSDRFLAPLTLKSWDGVWRQRARAAEDSEYRCPPRDGYWDIKEVAHRLRVTRPLDPRITKG